MRKKVYLLVLLLCGCAGAQQAEIRVPDVVPEAVDYAWICKYKEQKTLPSAEELVKLFAENRNADFRSCDLSQMDLSMYPSNLADYVDFDSKTRWPEADKMPKGFEPEEVLRDGVNPGLGVRSLHAEGITGRGVSVAIIDQPLLTTHQEYAGRLKFYEQQENCPEAQMHGPAVASIIVGRTVGVAPEADLYYIATRFGRLKGDGWDVRPEAEALKRLLEINKTLPAKNKIRVISLSLGGLEDPESIGAQQWKEGLAEARRQGVAVFTTDHDIFALSRACSTCDADAPALYTRGAGWFEERDYERYPYMEKVLFPTDYRVTAAPNGDGDYASYASSGLSWAVPYAAGLYALAAQVYPPLTPELFWQTARETAVAATVKTPQGKTYSAKYLVQPQRLIKKLQNMKQ